MGKLTELMDLNLSGLQASNIDILANFTKLSSLTLAYSQVHKLDALKGLPLLRYLDIEKTLVKDLSILPSLPSLHTLRAQRTEIEDISALAHVPNLVELNLQETKVRDLTPLSKLKKITFIGLNGTPISDISPVSSINSLTELAIKDTKFLLDLRPITRSLSLFYGAAAKTGDGLVFKGCGACELDPDGLGILSEIADNSERTERTFQYLRELSDWPPDPFSDLDEVFQFETDQVGRIELAHFAPDQEDATDKDKASLYDELKELFNDVALATGNQQPEVTRSARRHLSRLPENYSQSDALIIYLATEWARGIYQRRDERAGEDRLSPGAVEALYGILLAGPGIVLGNPRIDQIEERRARFAATPLPYEQAEARREIARAIERSDEVFGDRARTIAGMTVESNDDSEDRRIAVQRLFTKQALTNVLRRIAAGVLGKMRDRLFESMASWLQQNSAAVYTVALSWAPNAVHWVNALLESLMK